LVVTFERMAVWVDPVARGGPEAMAVDEWLMDSVGEPCLRVYRWDGAWGSVGYFGDLEAAITSLPGLRWVRRWTGGGIVDHREDWTYTLVVPAGEPLAEMRGAESYRRVHEVLAGILAEEGIDAGLAAVGGISKGGLCFEQPVGHDLVGPDGAKLAGAGQRRCRLGLLHQGSVAAVCDTAGGTLRARRFADGLARDVSWLAIEPPEAWIADKVASRYGSTEWTAGRRGRQGHGVI
jgi:lipoyl(octanoyl) transferase